MPRFRAPALLPTYHLSPAPVDIEIERLEITSPDGTITVSGLQLKCSAGQLPEAIEALGRMLQGAALPEPDPAAMPAVLKCQL